MARHYKVHRKQQDVSLCTGLSSVRMWDIAVCVCVCVCDDVTV
jgi:hypothetical protein